MNDGHTGGAGVQGSRQGRGPRGGAAQRTRQGSLSEEGMPPPSSSTEQVVSLGRSAPQCPGRSDGLAPGGATCQPSLRSRSGGSQAGGAEGQPSGRGLRTGGLSAGPLGLALAACVLVPALEVPQEPLLGMCWVKALPSLE